MTDERLRALEQTFRTSGDPADLTRWLGEALRSGVRVELWPLETAADCGSRAAALALGREAQPSSAVGCFRTLCAVLERNDQGSRVRAHLAATLVRDLEPAGSTDAEGQQTLTRELLSWTGAAEDSRRRQARCLAFVPQPPGPDTEQRAALFAQAYRRGVMVMSPNARASSWALRNLMSLIASGWMVGTPELLEASRGEREALLVEVQTRIEAWAFATVASSLRGS